MSNISGWTTDVLIPPSVLGLRALITALTAISLLSGCSAIPRLDVETTKTRTGELSAENNELRVHAAKLEKELARLQLEILEQNARIGELETALGKRKQELVDAHARLQRIGASIHTGTGPAQAASALAEAEAAYQVAVSQGDIDPAAEPERMRKIQELLQKGTSAYESGEYVRTIMFADNILRSLSPEASGPRAAGNPSTNYPERVFANPVDFRVKVRSHVRRGPGMVFSPVTYLHAGTAITGIAWRGQWVKIRGPGDLNGWIFRELLGPPE